jgi:phage shock protein B
MDESWIAVPITAIASVVIGLPWLILHYLTRWKTARGISQQDEVLMDELHDMARRLDGRIESIERIITADNPGWKEGRLPDATDRPNIRELRDERRR